MPPDPRGLGAFRIRDEPTAFDAEVSRHALEPMNLRQLGIPDMLMSDFEFHAALYRDRAASLDRDGTAVYDRRGLLNVIAYLVRERRPQRAGLAFAALAETSRQRALRWHPGGLDDWPVERWSNAMAGEAGEACGEVKRLNRIEDGIANLDAEGNDLQDRDEAIRALGLELADVVIYADLLAQRVGLNLADQVVAKFDLVSERYGFPERLGLAAPPAPQVRELDDAEAAAEEATWD